MLFRKDNKNNVENPAIKKGKANEKFNPSKKAHIIPKQNAGKFLIYILSETDKDRFIIDSFKPDLLYINTFLSRKMPANKFNAQRIIFTNNRKYLNQPDSLQGKNSYNLNQGAKWIELQ